MKSILQNKDIIHRTNNKISVIEVIKIKWLVNKVVRLITAKPVALYFYICLLSISIIFSF